MDGIYSSGRISFPQQVSVSPPGLQVPAPRDYSYGTAVQVCEDDNERSNCEYFVLRRNPSPIRSPSDDVCSDGHQSSLFPSHNSTCEDDLEHDGEIEPCVTSAPSSHSSSSSSFSSFSTDLLSSLSSISQNGSSRIPSLATVTESDSVNDSMLFPSPNHLQPILGVTAENPAPSLDFSDCRYPQYADEQSRLNSFRDWPSHLTQTSHQMSSAGFYYTSFSDWVRCFCCGIGVRNWAPNDDPWAEHARWSPRCSYIRLMKNPRSLDVLEHAVQERQQEEITQPSVPLFTPPRIPQNVSDGRPSINGQAAEKYPDKTLEKNPLLTDAAQDVLKMGFLPKQVKRAIDIVLQKKTWRTMTAMDVVDVLTEVEPEVTTDSSSSPEAEAETRDEYKPEDVEKLKETNENLRERTICKMCCTGKVSIVFLPCGHLVSCGQCSPALRKCPMCRQDIKGTVRVKFN